MYISFFVISLTVYSPVFMFLLNQDSAVGLIGSCQMIKEKKIKVTYKFDQFWNLLVCDRCFFVTVGLLVNPYFSVWQGYV